MQDNASSHVYAKARNVGIFNEIGRSIPTALTLLHCANIRAARMKIVLPFIMSSSFPA
jgi:hypothetical protein